MVKIIDYSQHENAEGKPFFSLTLQGELIMVRSEVTGLFYATAKQAFVTSTFDEKACQGLIGSEMPGKIVKTPCEPYEYAIPETGEIINLQHRWMYLPEAVTEEQIVFEGKTEEAIAQ
jgi:hypothetical protein